MTNTPTDTRQTWRTELDELTASQEGKYVTIEILDPEIGDEPEVEQLPFAYATYDPKDDAVIIGVGRPMTPYPVVLRHIVTHPQTVEVDAIDENQPTVRVVDGDGTATLVTFFPDSSG
jgi:hypothetical protein